MKTFPIVWVECPNVSERYDGLVNGTCMFIIDIKGKKNPKYVLQSYPFRSGIFTAANNTKKLFEDSSLEIVKMMADSNLKLFVAMFVAPATLEPATLTMFTMYHMKANRDRGILISDTDDLMKLAEGFEKKYKETEGKDWEKSKTDWETAIINFYNKNKHFNWNHID
jgi:hypothetical protein